MSLQMDRELANPARVGVGRSTSEAAAARTLRSCDGCTLCCSATALPALGKPCGIRCGHLGANGCSIHDQRDVDPAYKGCQSFQCLWSQGWAEESDRPDRLGVIFGLTNDPDRPGEHRMHVFEREPGCVEHPRVREIINEVLVNGMDVTISNTQYIVGVRTSGDAWRYPLDPADPMRSRPDLTATPVQILVRGQAVNVGPKLRPAPMPN